MRPITFALLIICFFPLLSLAQKNSPHDFGFSVIAIKGRKDSIKFIVSDTSFNKRKPVFLFCQGSLPTPLFWKEDSLHTWRQYLPFTYEKYLDRYNFVIISKPGLPVFSYNADKDYNYVDPVTGKVPQLYYDNSYLDKYVELADDVVNYLARQPWVDAHNIVIAGHSQGSKIVSKLGAINKHVKAVAYLSGNPIGRIDQQIRQLRKDAMLKKISDEEAQRQINEIYSTWERINQRPNDTHSDGGDTNKAWTSFSQPLLAYLLKIKAPLFIGYGTADNTADYCDLLPIDMIRAGKHNFYMRPYLGYDHNYCKVTYDGSGEAITGESEWDMVAADIFAWLDTLK